MICIKLKAYSSYVPQTKFGDEYISVYWKHFVSVCPNVQLFVAWFCTFIIDHMKMYMYIYMYIVVFSYW